MQERPILFSSEMVRAILDGRKTQTRRIVKPQPTEHHQFKSVMYGHEKLGGKFSESVFPKCFVKLVECPYGVPGDRLYVKEAWQTGEKLDDMNATEMESAAQEAGYENGPYGPLWYPADGSYRQWGERDAIDFGNPGRKRSSRFMPKWASRITLEITEVRVERLQEIGQGSACAEGCPTLNEPIEWFSVLWDSINGNIYPWDSNCWVWVISFKRIKP